MGDWHGGEGGSALITMKVTVDDVKTVYGRTNGNEGNKSDAIFYQPGYGGSVKNPEFSSVMPRTSKSSASSESSRGEVYLDAVCGGACRPGDARQAVKTRSDQSQ